MMPNKKILLIDDHELFRVGLRLILDAYIEADLIEIEKISDVKVIKENIDVIILDICLPGLNGLDGMVILQKKWPDARIMLLSALSHHQDINQALASGASCFLNKNSAPSTICKTVAALLKERNMNTFSKTYNDNQPTAVVTENKIILSSRLLEILDLILLGESNKAIANTLHISEHTVRNQIATLMAHFEVHNRTQVVLAAQRAGYLPT